jgi:hypothetical protein
VKPEFWIDEKIVELPMPARLLFIGLWNFADDQGYIDDKPRRIKMQVFPGDDVDVEKLLAELLLAGLLTAYDSPVGPVLHIRNWDKHQKVDRASAARFDASTLVVRPAPLYPAMSVQEEPPREPSTKAIEGSLASLDAEGKGSGSGGDLDLDREGIARRAPRTGAREPPLSLTRRAKAITDAYAAAEPMCRWPAVNGIVLKALKADKWADEEIHAALLRLAKEGRSVTVETLRVELAGRPPNGHAEFVEREGIRLRADTAANIDRRAHFEAMDRLAIEGPQ